MPRAAPAPEARAWAGADLAQAHRPLVVERHGLHVALLGYDEFLPRRFEADYDSAGVAWSEDEQVQHDIAEARRRYRADLVVPFMHWGWENEPVASPRQRRLARLMIDAGRFLPRNRGRAQHDRIIHEARETMNRPRLNFLIDSVAFVAFVFLTTTGILTRYVLPPGSGRFVTLWGLDRHGWGDIHFWIAVVLLGVLALHLVLHWRWVACMVRGQQSEASGSRVALGVVGLAGLLALAAAPLLTPVERTGEPRQLSRWSPPAIPAPQNPQPRETTEEAYPPLMKERAQDPQERQPNRAPEFKGTGAESIRGSMTLRQVAEATGVPLGHLVKQLGLPRGFDPDERIGRIRKQYDISPDDVRRVVKEYGETH